MPLVYICSLKHTHPNSLILFCVSIYVIPSVSTSKLVNKLFEHKNSTLRLFKLMKFKYYKTELSWYILQVSQKSEKDGSLSLGLT